MPEEGVPSAPAEAVAEQAEAPEQQVAAASQAVVQARDEGDGAWVIWWFFERICERAPDTIATIETDGTEVTYAELRLLAERLDRLLRHHDVRPGCAVMLVSEVSTWALACLLAVIRVGAVFVPNDPAMPALKRTELIEVAGLKHVLCQRQVDGLPKSVTALLSTAPLPAAAAAGALQPAASYKKTDLAGLFFSSGSTGVPKGVRHPACIWLELIGVHEYDPATTSVEEAVERGLSPTTWSDGFWHGAITWYSNWGLVYDIMAGKTVAIVTKEILLDAPLLRELRERQHARGQPKHMYFPPAHLRTILATEPGVLSDLELIYTWGEKMNEDMVKETGRQYPEVHLLDWLGTSETFLGIHRRFKASDGIATAHWGADVSFDARGDRCFS
jgi:acyl-coenzyme A synthetase/AMP-(fatty) acid ligase